VGILIYSALASLDGCIENRQGEFGWAAPDEEVFRFLNNLERTVGTYLYGRRMYETMVYWETAGTIPDRSPAEADFTRIWQTAEKVVYSRSLQAVSSARTRIETDFDPTAIRHLKVTAEQDITVGGADLAGQALTAGVVDQLQLFVVPVVVGGGKGWLAGEARLDLELLETERFASGVVFLRYGVSPSES
jgi:dihydrofolate reductase